jgi:beta-phosphoglucomutase
MTAKYQAGLFDLDGVIVDTAKYHYLAWRNLARQLGFEFTEKDNQRLKGVSRMRSLEILLEVGGMTLDDERKTELAKQKNEEYVAYIKQLDRSELLPGAKACLQQLREKSIKTALGSASKNAPLILKNLEIEYLFDAVIDGNKVSKAKPDPEVFLLGAQEIGVPAAACIVFEDAEAGLQAARAAGMFAVGIGRAEELPSADIVFPGLHAVNVNELFDY